MLRSFTLAALLMLTLFWASTAWAEPASSSAPSQASSQTTVEIDPAIAAGSAVTGEDVITVTTTTDELNIDGDCSLREAIQAAYVDISLDICDQQSRLKISIRPTHACKG